jgi:hypothetical protein
MKELRIKISLMAKHPPEAVEQLAHDGDDGDLGFLAASEEGLITSLDLRTALDGDQGGHEQSQAQMAITGSANVTRGVVLAALARPWVEPGVSHPLMSL